MSLPLTTERLRLRPPTIDDFGSWHAISLDAEQAWYGAPRSSEDQIQANLEKHIEHQDRHGFTLWAVELRDRAEIIGAAGLKHLADGPEIEVGYRFLKDHWGRGYATEAAAASIAFGFEELGLDRIVAVALPENTASRRVLEKCGLTEMGLTHVYGLEHVKYEIAR